MINLPIGICKHITRKGSCTSDKVKGKWYDIILHQKPCRVPCEHEELRVLGKGTPPRRP